MTHRSFYSLTGVVLVLSACSGGGDHPPPIGDAGASYTPPVIIETGGRGSTGGEAGTSSNGYSGSLSTSAGTSVGGSAGDTSLGGSNGAGDTSFGGSTSGGATANGGTGDVGAGATFGSGGS